MDKLCKITKNKKCVGCGACANACNCGAIEMQLNSEGFYYPVLNREKCVHCGLCEQSCPVLNATYDNSATPDCYAVMAEDNIREFSSSGGAFTLIANQIFAKNGSVCGVAFSGDYKKTRHIIIHDSRDMKLLRGSKYIMSDTGSVFYQIRELLKQKQYVLFSGVPCQVAGLKSYLKEDATSPYLLTVLAQSKHLSYICEMYMGEEK